MIVIIKPPDDRDGGVDSLKGSLDALVSDNWHVVQGVEMLSRSDSSERLIIDERSWCGFLREKGNDTIHVMKRVVWSSVVCARVIDKSQVLN